MVVQANALTNQQQVGVTYMLKLGHMVEDKMHARDYRTILIDYSATSWW